jgi:FkbM family methyltransferase
MSKQNNHTFIDLGAFNGDTIELALRHIRGIENVYGFEPLEVHYEAMKERFKDSGYSLINAAADIKDGKSEIFLGAEYGDIASSTHAGNPNCSVESQVINTIDFPRFLREKFGTNSPSGRITLKLNIEGTEYRILEQMIMDGTIQLVDKIYCDWHWYFIGMTEEQHHLLVKRLRRLGFDLCGGKPDELYHCARVGPLKTRLLKQTVYYGRSLKLFIRDKFPPLFSLLKHCRQRLRNSADQSS